MFSGNSYVTSSNVKIGSKFVLPIWKCTYLFDSACAFRSAKVQGFNLNKIFILICFVSFFCRFSVFVFILIGIISIITFFVVLVFIIIITVNVNVFIVFCFLLVLILELGNRV